MRKIGEGSYGIVVKAYDILMKKVNELLSYSLILVCGYQKVQNQR